MFNANVRRRTVTASTHGFLYQACSTPSFLQVRPHTRPRSSDSGFGCVTSETRMVNATHAHHAHHARHMDAPTELSSEIRYSTTPSAVPVKSPANPPQPVVRRQNIPKRNVPNNGARKMPCRSCT